jgi:hypothetical protein
MRGSLVLTPTPFRCAVPTGAPSAAGVGCNRQLRATAAGGADAVESGVAAVSHTPVDPRGLNCKRRKYW